jgi:hypothetical protein
MSGSHFGKHFKSDLKKDCMLQKIKVGVNMQLSPWVINAFR